MLSKLSKDFNRHLGTPYPLTILVLKFEIVDTTTLPRYNTVRYDMVLDITQFKDGSQKCIDYIEKMTINGHFYTPV